MKTSSQPRRWGGLTKREFEKANSRRHELIGLMHLERAGQPFVPSRICNCREGLSAEAYAELVAVTAQTAAYLEARFPGPNLDALVATVEAKFGVKLDLPEIDLSNRCSVCGMELPASRLAARAGEEK